MFLENEKLYKRLNVRLLERGESFYQPMMQGIVDDLKNRGKHTTMGQVGVV